MTYKLRMTHISGGILSPLRGVNLFPWAQFGRKLRPLPPPADAPDLRCSGRPGLLCTYSGTAATSTKRGRSIGA